MKEFENQRNITFTGIDNTVEGAQDSFKEILEAIQTFIFSK